MKIKYLPLGFVLLAFLSCSGKGPANIISASGTIEAVEVDVASKVAGQIKERPVDEGSRIRTGDTLALVDHDTLDIQLRQAEAGVALANAQLILLREGARREDIEQAQAALRQAEASLKVAEDDARRMRALEETGSATPKQREDAEARLTVAQAQRTAAAEALHKAQTLARPEEIKAAEAQLAQAKAGADLLRKTIADCTITAPVGGFVTHKAVEVGELVTQGSTIVQVSELDSVYVMIYVTEVELGRIRLGDRAEVSIDAFPKRTFPGRVTYISPEAEFTPKNVETKEDRVKLVFGVKIEIENKEGLLKPGLPADASIIVGQGGPAVTREGTT
jgi:HlyD family secretion protein